MNPFADPYRGILTNPADDEPNVKVTGERREPNFEGSLATRIREVKAMEEGRYPAPEVAERFRHYTPNSDLDLDDAISAIDPGLLHDKIVKEAIFRAEAAYEEFKAAVGKISVVDQPEAHRLNPLVREIGEAVDRFKQKL